MSSRIQTPSSGRLIPFVHQLDGLQAASWQQALQSLLPDVELVAPNDIHDSQLEQVTTAIVANPKPAELARFRKLQWVQSLWAGVEQLVAALPAHIQIARLVDPNLQRTMAEAVLAWSYYLNRDMPAYRQQQQQRLWQQHPARLACETRISVLGAGQLGIAACELLHLNGFQVSAWSRSEKKHAHVQMLWGEKGLIQALTLADIVVLLLPSTPATRYLLNTETISKMKPGAGMINFARGDVIDKQSLLEALDDGILSHAVLDVFDTEPLPSTNLLWQHPKITVLPHISAPTNQQTAAKIVAHNIREFLTLGTLPTLVDRHKGY